MSSVGDNTGQEACVAAVSAVPNDSDHASTRDRSDFRSAAVLPLGEPLLDARLADLTETGKPQKLHRYLEKRRRGRRAAYLARLGDEGLVEERSSRVLGIFTFWRW